MLNHLKEAALVLDCKAGTIVKEFVTGHSGKNTLERAKAYATRIGRRRGAEACIVVAQIVSYH